MTTNMTKLNKSAEKASQLLKAIGNPNRLVLLCMLADEERSVPYLLEKTKISQSALSQGLTRMRNEGLLESRREGVRMFYKIENPIVKEIIKSLAKQFDIEYKDKK